MDSLNSIRILLKFHIYDNYIDVYKDKILYKSINLDPKEIKNFFNLEKDPNPYNTPLLMSLADVNDYSLLFVKDYRTSIK